jgi:hypothetical protein
MESLPYETVTFGDKEYIIKFGFNAVASIEESFGKGIQFIFNEENVGFRTIRALYWAGLKWKNQGLTIEVVGNMLEKKMEDEDLELNELMAPVLKAIGKARIFRTKKTNEISEDTAGGEEASPN